MSQPLDQSHMVMQLLMTLETTVEHVHGIYLAPGTSLLETLAGITAEQASIPVGGRCATLAAQVAHIAFYLEVNSRELTTGIPVEADWDEIWRTVGAVSPAEWDALRQNLRETYQRVHTLIKNFDNWGKDYNFVNVIGMLVHTAYHLGEIRQALCVLRDA